MQYVIGAILMVVLCEYKTDNCKRCDKLTAWLIKLLKKNIHSSYVRNVIYKVRGAIEHGDSIRRYAYEFEHLLMTMNFRRNACSLHGMLWSIIENESPHFIYDLYENHMTKKVDDAFAIMEKQRQEIDWAEHDLADMLNAKIHVKTGNNVMGDCIRHLDDAKLFYSNMKTMLGICDSIDYEMFQDTLPRLEVEGADLEEVTFTRELHALYQLCYSVLMNAGKKIPSSLGLLEPKITGYYELKKLCFNIAIKSLSKHSRIFGGVPRSCIEGRAYNDIDVLLDNEREREKFICNFERLIRADKLVKSVEALVYRLCRAEYTGCDAIRVEMLILANDGTKLLLNIDLVINITEPMLDFDVNQLAIYKGGTMGLLWRTGDYYEDLRSFNVITDNILKKQCVMYNLKRELCAGEHKEDDCISRRSLWGIFMRRRIEKMTKKGYTIINEPCDYFYCVLKKEKVKPTPIKVVRHIYYVSSHPITGIIYRAKRQRGEDYRKKINHHRLDYIKRH
jgi:hypothetical protein